MRTLTKRWRNLNAWFWQYSDLSRSEHANSRSLRGAITSSVKRSESSWKSQRSLFILDSKLNKPGSRDELYKASSILGTIPMMTFKCLTIGSVSWPPTRPSCRSSSPIYLWRIVRYFAMTLVNSLPLASIHRIFCCAENISHELRALGTIHEFRKETHNI